MRATRRGWHGPHRSPLPARPHLDVQGAGPSRCSRRGIRRDLAARSRGGVGALGRRMRPRRVVLRQASHRRARAARGHRGDRGGLRRLQGTHEDARAAPRALVHGVPGGVRRRG